MKKFFSIIVMILLSTSLSFAQESSDITKTPSEMKMAIVGIDGMACQEGCADKIAENLKSIEGVNSVEVSFKKKEAIINYNSSLTSIADLKSIITNTKVKEYVYIINSVTIKE